MQMKTIVPLIIFFILNDLKKEIAKKFFAAFEEVIGYGISSDNMVQGKMLIPVFTKMHHVAPHFVSTDFRRDFYGLDFSKFGIEDPLDTGVDGHATTKAIYDKFSDQCIQIRVMEMRLLIFEDKFIYGDDDALYMFGLESEFPKEIEDLIVHTEKNSTKYMHYVTYDSRGFNTMRMAVKEQECDLTTNYNDDLPYDKMTEFLNGDSSGIMVLHGIPGTGKTSVLRHLIYTTDLDFVFVDSSAFNSITDSSFIKLLIDNKNSVIVLEDCETLLQDRVAGNAKLSALLNLSDGILGDSLNLKFICTFNADLTRIDKAILRKGRMKLKYEFKALTPDKVKLLATKLGKNIPENKSMPLCDVYNYGEDNGNISNSKPIGFGS